MTVSIKQAPTLILPGASHWLELQGRSDRPPFAREEVHPILGLAVPRVGPVRAQFSADRYVANDRTRGQVWTDWRLILRSVRLPDPETPDNYHLGREAAGIGPAARAAIDDACEPVIRAWLETDDYRASRRAAAAFAVRREIDAPPTYRLEQARRTLARLDGELGPVEAERLAAGLSLLEQAAAMLDGELVGD